MNFSRWFLASFLGDWVNVFAAYLNAGSILAAGSAATWYLRRFGNPLIPFARLWILVVCALVVILAVRGFAQGLILRFVVYDASAFALILIFVVIGAVPQAFEDMRKVWFLTLVMAIPLNLAALTDMTAMLERLQTGDRVTHDTLSYRTQNILDVVVLLLPFAFTFSGWRFAVVVAGICLVLLQQVIYQKRLDSIYFLLVIAGSGWCWSRYRTLWRHGLATKFRRMLVMLILVAGSVLALGNRYFVPQLNALMDRFAGRSHDIRYDSGFFRYAALENERFEIIVESFASFRPRDWIFGRGMGGGVEWNGFEPEILSTSKREEVWDALYLPDYGYFGRRNFEVGVMTLVLKGGVLLFLAYYFGFVLMFLRQNQLRQSLVGLLCLWIVALQLTYSIIGGDFMLSAAFQMANTAACLGVGLSRFSTWAAPAPWRSK
ncbi:MAG: hypothetical protein JNL39_20700 [Opitutaceae bacterium]|nr:hypothetical protein [Opitutaceae bacterium]